MTPATTGTGTSLQLDQLTKAYGGRTVLSSIDLTIPAGHFVAIVGRSGCGKSTLLRLLSGLETPTDGAIQVSGSPLRGVNQQARIMFQDGRLLPWKTVLDNVGLGLRGQWRPQGLEVLRHVGLEDRAQDWIARLSGGQRQRVALAKALITRPRLMLLDEPLGALDALTRIEMQQLIEALWLEQGFTAILVTHDVEEAVTLADRILVLENGRVASDVINELPRPRRRGDSGFAHLTARVLESILHIDEGSGDLDAALSTSGPTAGDQGSGDGDGSNRARTDAGVATLSHSSSLRSAPSAGPCPVIRLQAAMDRATARAVTRAHTDGFPHRGPRRAVHDPATMILSTLRTSARSLFAVALASSLGAVAAVASLPSIALAQSNPAKLNTATIVKLDYATYNPVSLVLKEKGFLEQDLKKKNIKVEWVLSQGSNKALEFLNARSLDFGSTAGAAAFIGKANGNPIKSIYVYSKPEWASIVIPRDSKIQSVKDLKGKRVAANRGTDPYIFLLRSLYSNGINPRSVEIVQLSHADGKTALERGNVDAWAGLDPLTARAELESKAKILYRNPSFNSFGVLNVREQFAKENPDTVLTVLRAYEKARQWAVKNPEGLTQVLIKESKLTDAVASRQLERTDLTNPVIGNPQKVVILAAADVLKKGGVVPADTDIQVVVNKLIDPSFINRVRSGK